MQRRAFTLIELAIVLSIIGLIIGGSFQSIRSMRERNKIAEAKEQIETIKNAVIGYALMWPNLPSNAEFDANISIVTGSQVPIFYAVDANLSNIDHDICAYDTTNLTLVDNSISPPRIIPNIAFVLAHASVNANMQTALNTSISPYRVNIYSPSAKVDDNATPINIAEPYDDIVSWVTLSELQNLVQCSQNSLKIITDYALPRDINGTNYTGATIYADGGFPFTDGGDADSAKDYEWCLENAPAWLNANICNGALISSADCATATYNRCTSPYLYGTSTEGGTFGLKVYVRDSAARENVKSFSITVDFSLVGDGGGGGTLLPPGAPCTADSQCQSGNCKNNNTCK
ncbi:MAG: type II secretion system protein [Sulfurimonas sp.]|jgi:prepilin-type N-terminal cleavage/methylation domain-containing protein